MFIREATPADAASIARVHNESWRTSYRGIVPEEHLAQLCDEETEGRWWRILASEHGRGFTYVAEDASSLIVGFANGGEERSGDPVYRGELYAIYLLAAHQRKGLGRRLTLAVVERLLRMGFDSMLVWVLAANPARFFYEALGAERVREDEIEIGGVAFPELAYGWRDLRKLAANASGDMKAP
jgi:ribosomal protein S18 acetylase RimI-like enzyme